MNTHNLGTCLRFANGETCIGCGDPENGLSLPDPKSPKQEIERSWVDPNCNPYVNCHECNGLGYVNCFCGGDMCVCGTNEMPCHTCYPGHYYEDDDERD